MLPLLLTLGLVALRQDGPHPVFDGTSLDGWWGCSAENHAAHERKDEPLSDEWQVVDGALFSAGSRQRLATAEDFADAEIELEFLVGEAAFGGLYLRGRSLLQIVDASIEHPLGLAFGALNDGGGLYPGYQGTGGIPFNPRWTPGFIPLTVADRPPGEWNHLRLVLVGARLSAWLNGTLIHDHVLLQNEQGRSKGFPSRGPVELACFRGPIHWRNLSVREADSIEATQVLASSEADEFSLPEWSEDTAAWKRDGELLTAVEDVPGVIQTAGELDDFAVRFSFRLQKDSRAGVTLHHAGDSNLCEVVLSGSAEAGEFGWTGSALGLANAREAPLRPYGEWNFQEIRVRGTRVQVDLNGYRVLDADVARVGVDQGGTDGVGAVGLVSYGTQIEVRELRIQPLAGSWPTLEPFWATRFWEMVPAFSGAQPGARFTPENLETIVEVFASFTSTTAEAKEAGERIAAEMGEPTPEVGQGMTIGPPPSGEYEGLFSAIPVVMHALEPLWTDDDWDGADLALARAAATQLAGLPGLPELGFEAEQTEDNHRRLAHLAAWFTERTREPEWYASMFFTLDEGPWRVVPTNDRAGRRPIERMPLGYGAELRLLPTDPEEAQLVGVVRDGRILHRAWITDVPGNYPLTFEKVGEAMEVGDYSWRIQARFGVPGDIERLTLFLDDEFRPLFYFASW